MFDLASLVIGAVALSSVFTTIVQTIQILAKAQTQNQDLQYFEAIIRLQGIRLYHWAVTYQSMAAKLHDEPSFRMSEQSISRALQVIMSCFGQAFVLFEKHDFPTPEYRTTTPLVTPKPSQLSVGDDRGSGQPTSYNLVPVQQHTPANRSQDTIALYLSQPLPTSVPQMPQMKKREHWSILGKLHLKTEWAVKDTIMLDELVKRVISLVDGLEATLKGLEARTRE